jgi:pSer/pThr/pTyr-binding forkhead associated (FHA) protein
MNFFAGGSAMTRLQLSGPNLNFETQAGQEAFVVGRLSECECAIQHTTVSRQHAEIFWRPAGWFIRDLGSKHGVLVNGIAVKMTKFKDGDELQLGEVVLTVNLIRESPISSARMQGVSAEELGEPTPARRVIKIDGMGGSATTIMRDPPTP